MQKKQIVGAGIFLIVLISIFFVVKWYDSDIPRTSTSTSQSTSTEITSTSADIQTTYRDRIRVETPIPESTIFSPLTIQGEARGTWFFEASFPVILTDWDGRVIAEGHAEATSDWMTEAYVPFTATLSFEADTSVSNRGTLILKKDNPSGLPEYDDAFEYTVFFAQ